MKVTDTPITITASRTESKNMLLSKLIVGSEDPEVSVEEVSEVTELVGAVVVGVVGDLGCYFRGRIVEENLRVAPLSADSSFPNDLA